MPKFTVVVCGTRGALPTNTIHSSVTKRLIAAGRDGLTFGQALD
jgi:hypothetical protein